MLRKPIKEMNIREKVELASALMADETSLGQEATKLDNLLDKLDAHAMTVAVIGQFKRGKSALSNALLGEELFPVGIVPITGAVTKATYGEKKAQVLFQNGICKDIDFDELSQYISEQENRNNDRKVQEVRLQTPSPFLKNDILFVDTPGVGSFHQNNTDVAYDYLKESDGVIFLLSVDSPINQIEIDFLRDTKEYAGKFYFVVNKADLVSPEELHAYITYCEGLLHDIMGISAEQELRILPVSAKTQEGVPELSEAITRDIAAHCEEILEASAGKKLMDIIDRSLVQLNFYWKALNLEYKELDAHFQAVQETTQEIRTRANDVEGNFRLHLNEFRQQLSHVVQEEFGMEFFFPLDVLEDNYRDMTASEFSEKVDILCASLMESLQQILLYRDDNAYAVVHRANGINRLSRELRRIRDSLKEA